MLTIKEKVKSACEHSGVSMTEVGRQLGMTQQSMSNRLKTGKFTQDELHAIAKAIGCKYISAFEFEDGTRIE